MSRSKIYKLSDEDFKKLVNESESLSDMLRKVGLNDKGGNNRKVLRDRIEKLNLDTSHFIKLKLRNSSYNLENALIYGSKVTNQKIIQILLENNLKDYVCEGCGCDGNWLGVKITLQLHHIDGDNKNNVLDNLQILCPNCHSITDNFGSKNKNKVIEKDIDIYYLDKIDNYKKLGDDDKYNYRTRKKKKYNCLNCNNDFYTLNRKPKFCSLKCSCEYKRKTNSNIKINNICKGCNKEYELNSKKTNTTYCCNECYLNNTSIKIDISDEELDNLLLNNTQKDVASILGIGISSLRNYLRRKKKRDY